MRTPQPHCAHTPKSRNEPDRRCPMRHMVTTPHDTNTALATRLYVHGATPFHASTRMGTPEHNAQTMTRGTTDAEMKRNAGATQHAEHATTAHAYATPNSQPRRTHTTAQQHSHQSRAARAGYAIVVRPGARGACHCVSNRASWTRHEPYYIEAACGTSPTNKRHAAQARWITCGARHASTCMRQSLRLVRASRGS